MNESQGNHLKDSGSHALTELSAGQEPAGLESRLAAKAIWKNQKGNRYTPVELKRMSETAEVKISRPKRVVMRY